MLVLFCVIGQISKKRWTKLIFWQVLQLYGQRLYGTMIGRRGWIWISNGRRARMTKLTGRPSARPTTMEHSE